MNRVTITHFVAPNEPLRLIELPMPEIEASEVLVTIHTAAICGSDLHTWQGRRPEAMPSVLGHEGIGSVIVSQRSGVTEGDLVTWSLVDSCGQCPACRVHGIPQKCESLWKYGHGGAGLDGTYATHLRIRAGTAIFPVPKGLDLGIAATANCALATAVQACRELPPPGRAAVIGSGLVGLFAAFLLQTAGFETKIVEIHPDRARLAESLGFVVVPQVVGPIDLLVEAAGVRQALADAIDTVRPGGEIRLVGLVHPDSALDLTAEKLIRRCWTLRGSHNYAPSSLATALERAQEFRTRLPADFEMGPVFSLADIDAAIARAMTKQDLRVLVRPSRES